MPEINQVPVNAPGVQIPIAMRQKLLADQLMAQQAQTGTPIYSKGVAIAKALAGGLGGMMANRDAQNIQDEQTKMLGGLALPVPGEASGTPSAAAPTSDTPASGAAMNGQYENTQAGHEAFIRDYAAKVGIDPDFAVSVAKAEGLRALSPNNPNSASTVDIDSNGKPFSFGDYQLNVRNGLGNLAMASGIDPKDPAQWQAANKFSLDHMAQHGLQPWKGDAAVEAYARTQGKPSETLGAPRARAVAAGDVPAPGAAKSGADVLPPGITPQSFDAQSPLTQAMNPAANAAYRANRTGAATPPQPAGVTAAPNAPNDMAQGPQGPLAGDFGAMSAVNTPQALAETAPPPPPALSPADLAALSGALGPTGMTGTAPPPSPAGAPPPNILTEGTGIVPAPAAAPAPAAQSLSPADRAAMAAALGTPDATAPPAPAAAALSPDILAEGTNIVPPPAALPSPPQIPQGPQGPLAGDFGMMSAPPPAPPPPPPPSPPLQAMDNSAGLGPGAGGTMPPDMPSPAAMAAQMAPISAALGQPAPDTSGGAATIAPNDNLYRPESDAGGYQSDQGFQDTGRKAGPTPQELKAAAAGLLDYPQFADVPTPPSRPAGLGEKAGPPAPSREALMAAALKNQMPPPPMPDAAPYVPPMDMSPDMAAGVPPDSGAAPRNVGMTPSSLGSGVPPSLNDTLWPGRAPPQIGTGPSSVPSSPGTLAAALASQPPNAAQAAIDAAGPPRIADVPTPPSRPGLESAPVAAAPATGASPAGPAPLPAPIPPAELAQALGGPMVGRGGRGESPTAFNLAEANGFAAPPSPSLPNLGNANGATGKPGLLAALLGYTPPASAAPAAPAPSAPTALASSLPAPGAAPAGPAGAPGAAPVGAPAPAAAPAPTQGGYNPYANVPPDAIKAYNEIVKSPYATPEMIANAQARIAAYMPRPIPDNSVIYNPAAPPSQQFTTMPLPHKFGQPEHPGVVPIDQATGYGPGEGPGAPGATPGAPTAPGSAQDRAFRNLHDIEADKQNIELDAKDIAASRDTSNALRNSRVSLNQSAQALDSYGGRMPTGPLGDAVVWGKGIASQIGLGSDKELANMQLFAKNATQYATQQLKAITNKATNLDMTTELKNNPGMDLSFQTNRILVDHLQRVNQIAQDYNLAKQNWYDNHDSSLKGFQQAYQQHIEGAGAVPLSKFPVDSRVVKGVLYMKVPSTAASGYSLVTPDQLQ